MNILETLVLAADELRRLRVPFALVGGLAVSVRAEPRFTRDIDVAVAVADDQAAEALVHHFLQVGFRVLATVEQEATGRLATVRLAAPGEDDDGPIIDLLFASSGIEAEIAAAATVESIAPGVDIPVATTGHLIAMKVLAEQPSRFQDSADIMALLTTAGPADLESTRHAVEVIRARGAARGKDLAAVLERYLALASEAGGS